MAEKFNIRPVYVDFLNTLDVKLSSSEVGSVCYMCLEKRAVMDLFLR